jgi:nucleotide-binding universal stress UspA family protein
MRDPILAGFRPRPLDHAPVRAGAVLARLTDAPLRIAAVRPVMIGGLDGDVGDCLRAVERIDAEVREWQLEVDCVELQGWGAAGALHEAAERLHARLIVVGTSAREGRMLGGPTAERILHGAPCAVAVVPRDWTGETSPQLIGAAYDGGDEARVALHTAYGLARRANATVLVVTLVQWDPEEAAEAGTTLDQMLVEARHRAEREVRGLPGDVPVQIDAVPSDAAAALVELSSGLDLLLCGSRRHGPLRAVHLGSTTRRLTAEARCPVVVLPCGARTPLVPPLAASQPSPAGAR